MFKGSGTINGVGNYGFQLSAIDEVLTPSTDDDLFRIKIWDKDNGDAVVYDNQVGETDDNADPTTAIGGGNIKIQSTGGAPNKFAGDGLTPVDEVESMPTEFALLKNYPNPFNHSTVIRFDVPETAHISLHVYDIVGREVATLVDGVTEAGRHELIFDARALPSGIYLYRLDTSQSSLTQTMQLVK